jgi:YkoY family integral membrane protein
MNELFNSILSHLPGWPELVSALPVILSLIMIEGLLSIDNAMAIAALASGLPRHQQITALRLGIIGAYTFRGVCLFLASYIASNPWLKIFGAVYLIYLMCKHLVDAENGAKEDTGITGKVAEKGLLATIVSIEVMDLSLSLDNIVAAVALDKRLWVICTGVFIGILALRFVAGYCIKLIEKFPVLQKTAFLLVGFVGVILLTEICLEGTGVHFHINSFWKFVGIIAITMSTIAYSHTKAGKKFLNPVVKGGMPILRILNQILSWTMLPFVAIFGLVKKLFHRTKKVSSLVSN